MARKRFTPEQIVAILREAERGVERKALFRKHGISEQTFYRWKRMYGGLGVSKIKRIRQLEEENRKLKELVGEQAMVIQAQKEVMKKRVGLRVTVRWSRCYWGMGWESDVPVGLWVCVEGRSDT